MRFTYHQDNTETVQADLLAIGVHQGRLKGEAVRFDKILSGHLRAHAEDMGFTGKADQRFLLHTHGAMQAKHVGLIGLGHSKDFDAEGARRAGGRAYRLGSSVNAVRLAVTVPENKEHLQGFLEGLLLASYRFERYRKTRAEEKGRRRIEEIILILPKGVAKAAVEKSRARAAVFAEANRFAQDLVNTPAKDMSPRHMVEAAEALAAASPRISLKVLGRKELEKMGCGGILAVAQGSEEEPYLVHLTYRPKKKTKRKIALVGKGVTFDSGGLSLKPASGMEDMKLDMAGAATVFGVFRALPDLEPGVEVHGIAALVENMPSGRAIRPGDIIETMSGKTVEILNTDAEGRVTLADSLYYGSQLEPDAMIDLATLTGACMAALGQDYAGLMTDDDRLAERLLHASSFSGERMWRLPLVEEYADQMKSRHADLKNISGTKFGGAITAGLFLKPFVGKTKWAHLDIAGPSYAEKERLSYHTWGASGFGVRTLLRFLSD